MCVTFWQLVLGITIEYRKNSDVWQLLQQITCVAFKQGQLMAFHFDTSSVQFVRAYEVNYILLLGILKVVAISLEIFSKHHENCVQT